MRKVVAWALIVAIVWTPLAAHTAPDAKHVEKIKTRAAYALGHHCLVTVETTDRRQLQGLVSVGVAILCR